MFSVNELKLNIHNTQLLDINLRGTRLNSLTIGSHGNIKLKYYTCQKRLFFYNFMLRRPSLSTSSHTIRTIFTVLRKRSFSERLRSLESYLLIYLFLNSILMILSSQKQPLTKHETLKPLVISRTLEMN